MIPKKIHYCWFGDATPGPKEQRCMDSWKRFCPDFEIVRWDETNSPIDETEYTRQAYEAKKWAFVSDYVRLNALFAQGGIYLDTDVELKKPLTAFLSHDAFMGFEDSTRVATCLMGARAGLPFLEQALAQYRRLSFLRGDGRFDYTTNVERLSTWLEPYGLRRDGSMQTVADITIYPRSFFSPKDLETGKLRLTADTHAIHHFQASWMPTKNRLNTKLAQILGPDLTRTLKHVLGRT